MTDPSTSPDEREHTLPSGLKVTVRSHRYLRREHIHKVWAAGNTAQPGNETAAQRDALMGILVESTSDPQTYPVPLTAGAYNEADEYVPGILDRLDGADYIAVCIPAFSPDLVHRDE